MPKTWTFPAGERGVLIPCDFEHVSEFFVNLNFKGSDSIIDVLLTVDAIRREYGKDSKIILQAPYFPYARQDRKMQRGESHSLKVIADLINACNFQRVEVVDPHSDVLEALVNNLSITHQAEAIIKTFYDFWSHTNLDYDNYHIYYSYDYFVAPDAGAMKKIYKIAEKTQTPVICAYKVRDAKSGEVTKTEISKQDFENLKGKRVLIIDDICDGGATFLKLAAALPDNKDCKKDLYVTHGIFSKGKEELYKHYENIFCYNDMSQQ